MPTAFRSCLQTSPVSPVPSHMSYRPCKQKQLEPVFTILTSSLDLVKAVDKPTEKKKQIKCPQQFAKAGLSKDFTN